ncbi:MAG: hypothetical protein A2176_09045 [Spirochaetes bacterium RBG_13_51_14]|nr:MAG: hypothetical protein A2176_09045 [Spirochaetes bacterium RBG_13_51_14]
MNRITNSIITNKFVRLIEENHQEIIEHFMNDVLRNKKTVAYQKLDPHDLYEIGSRVYRELSKWVAKDLPKDEVKEYYKKLGKIRKHEGIPASQFFQALVLLKRHMWLFIRRQVENEITDYKQAMQVSDRVVLFFDRAAYYMLTGYEDDTIRKW